MSGPAWGAPRAPGTSADLPYVDHWFEARGDGEALTADRELVLRALAVELGPLAGAGKEAVEGALSGAAEDRA